MVTRPRLSDFTDAPLVLVGDEAWSAEDFQRWKRRRDSLRRYRSRPEVKARQAEKHRAWRAANREEHNAYKREWERRRRLALGMKPREIRPPAPRYVGSLHSLACTGPTKATGCRCHKIRCYDKPR